ncbi:hypothetical protein CLPU_17c00030 [Gottschalkia purinilytica]|uniref:Uncharacterized protein n=1 Tax=Gottschalkia purinilytica TaxID=1503 RepID=A0A0L0W751_GOTPU|nr:hypothetical protein [Gottschalkia purinilytica]KNF07378.1 hypothetical protein CLPU_17c00030 [Gottschalkia purinilytica]
MKQNKLFRLMEWIGFIICLSSIFVDVREPGSVSGIFIFVGAAITFLFFILRKIIEKKEQMLTCKN